MLEKTKETLVKIGMGVLALGALVLGVLKIIAAVKKPDTQKLLVEDGKAKADAQAAVTASNDKLAQADAVAAKVDSIPEDENWTNNRKKF